MSARDLEVDRQHFHLLRFFSRYVIAHQTSPSLRLRGFVRRPDGSGATSRLIGQPLAGICVDDRRGSVCPPLRTNGVLAQVWAGIWDAATVSVDSIAEDYLLLVARAITCAHSLVDHVVDRTPPRRN